MYFVDPQLNIKEGDGMIVRPVLLNTLSISRNCLGTKQGYPQKNLEKRYKSQQLPMRMSNSGLISILLFNSLVGNTASAHT